LSCFSTSNTEGKHIFRYDSVRKPLDTPSYISNKHNILNKTWAAWAAGLTKLKKKRRM